LINTRENILEMVQRSPRLSTRRIASCIGVSRMQVWRTLHEENLHPHHDHRVQHLEPGDSAQRMDLCHWITAPLSPRSPDLTPLDYYLWGHMKTLVYETKVDSRTALCHRIFGAAEHIRNHPNNIASATQSLLMRAEKCIATGRGHFEQLL